MMPLNTALSDSSHVIPPTAALSHSPAAMPPTEALSDSRGRPHMATVWSGFPAVTLLTTALHHSPAAMPLPRR